MNANSTLKTLCLKTGILLALVVSQLSILIPQPCSAQTNCTPRPPGLVAWWPGDGFAFDVVGTNHGTQQNGATFGAGQVGLAFRFDGTDDYVRLPDNVFPYPATGTGTAPFSFQLWFKAETAGVLLGQQNSSPFQTPDSWVPAIYVDAVGRLRVEMFWGGSVSQVISSGSVTDGSFHHLIVTFGSSIETVYLDGIAIGSLNIYQYAYPGSYKYQLGTGFTRYWPNGNAGWFNFKGTIDEVAIFNRALTSSEVASIHAAGTAGICYTNHPVPVFVQQPTTQTGYLFNSGTLTGAAMGSPRPSYQWLSNNIPIPGATTNTLVLSNLTFGQAGSYVLLASNQFGEVPSATVTNLAGADSVADFAGVQGQGNWCHGYYEGTSATPFTSGDFKQLPNFVAGKWERNDAPGGWWTQLTQLGGHPNGFNQYWGRLPELNWAVRRWVSRICGIVDISVIRLYWQTWTVAAEMASRGTSFLMEPRSGHRASRMATWLELLIKQPQRFQWDHSWILPWILEMVTTGSTVRNSP